MERRNKPWVGWRQTFGEFCDHGIMSVEQRGQSGIVSNQEIFKQCGRICYEWRGFKISEKRVNVYGVKPVEGVKSWRRQWG